MSDDQDQTTQGDTLHGATAPTESAHQHEEDQPQPAEPETPAESEQS